VITAQREHLFYDMASVAGAAQVGFEETLGCALVCVCQMTERTAMLRLSCDKTCSAVYD